MPKDVYQQELDEIASRQRGNSPKFPTIAEALVKRRRAREDLAARLLLFFAFVSACGAFVAQHPGFWLAAFAFFGIGFLITNWVLMAETVQTGKFPPAAPFVEPPYEGGTE